jgi:hypothetical protein
MRTLFPLTTMIFLTSCLFASESGSVPNPGEIKAAQDSFINVYQEGPDKAVAFDPLRKHEPRKRRSDWSVAANTDLAASHRTCAYLTLITNNQREIPFLVMKNTHYNTIAGLNHLKRQLLACAFAAVDSDTKNQLFSAYQRLSAGIKELDFALQNYTGHLHLKDAP